MKGRTARIGAAAGLVGFLFVFFLPVLPLAPAVSPGCAGTDYCIGVFPVSLWPAYQSLGHFLTGWGATYWGGFDDGQNFGGYVPPVISYDFGGGYSALTAGGVVFLVVLPIVVVCAWLLSPELARFSKASRIGLGAFGGAQFALADLMLISTLQQADFPWVIVLTGAFFGASGILMMLYTMHTWPMGIWEREDLTVLG